MITYLQSQETELGLQNAVLYYDFPAYVDYETETTRPDILLFSPSYGFTTIRFVNDSLFVRSGESVDQIDSGLNDFSSNLYSRLLRSRELRRSRTQSKIEVHPILFDQTTENHAQAQEEQLESDVCSSFEQFRELLLSYQNDGLDDRVVAEARSVVEGAKALTKPQKRIVEDPEKQPLALVLSELEAEIANFDQKQRNIALVDVGGPARIRGLAGSGKTIILAMKVAHLHLNDPSKMILITFLTKSLRATIKSLITKFFRHYSENDPNWAKIHIRHGWGGSTIPGVYSDAASRANKRPITYSQARSLPGGRRNPFSAVCGELLSAVGSIEPYYDHVLIDEGQDFPASFYELCFHLTKGDRDRKSIIWAYDELQDIMNVKIRQPEELFGIDEDGQPRISLDRSASRVPPGATNDAILEKCYRNQRDVLVSAHALGFGIYGEIVQLLESADHWKDVGYEVLTGPLEVGKEVCVRRPDRNSPVHLREIEDFQLISHFAADNPDSEFEWVTRSIEAFITRGLAPEEIVVISLDDRNAKFYLNTLSERLALVNIATNNIIADPYNEPPFVRTGKVTLSTVYRAKGNEAAAVFAVGIDAVNTQARDGRNKIFTAFTRSKAWLRVSGIGGQAQSIFTELDEALDGSPEMRFVMPDLQEIETIQRGLSRKQSKAKAAREEFVRKLKAAGYSDEEIEEELTLGLKVE